MLKIIAVIAMTIDHIALFLLNEGNPEYNIMRGIGRLAFPIFCYQLVIGTKYTRDKFEYLYRLFFFGLISEIPYDLAYGSNITEHSNVMFTLFLGALTIFVSERIDDYEKYHIFLTDKKAFLEVLKVFLKGIVLSGCVIISVVMNTSYAGIGVMGIYFLYILVKNNKNILFGIPLFCYSVFQIPAVCSFLIIDILKDRPEKRKINKWFFYIYYPAHLFILFLIKKKIGMF